MGLLRAAAYVDRNDTAPRDPALAAAELVRLLAAGTRAGASSEA